jgi:hypothetical protein
VRLLVVKAIQASIGFAGGGAAGLIGGFALADGGVMGASIDTNTAVPARAFAKGGIANSPTIALFGERQPEAFVPLPDGKTIPVTMNQGQQQQQQPPIVVNISAIDSQSFARTVDQEREVIVDAVNKVLRRSPGARGTFRKSIGS